MPPSLTINQDFANQMIARVDANITQEIFITTVDKAKLCLNDALRRMEQRRAWVAPAGILATLAVVFPTASFHDLLLTKDTWLALFITFTVLDAAWLVSAVRNRPKSLSVEAIIEELRKGSSVSLSSSSPQEQFTECFEGGLGHWEYDGAWRVIREDDKHTLVVTNSEIGGIAQPCRLWTDYTCEFETKIAKSNTSWVVRAKDTSTYVMLQCETGRIYPHFRVNGTWTNLDWTRRNPVPLPVTLPLDTWFGVRIEVKDFHVMVTLIVDGKEIVVSAMTNPLLKPPIAPIEYAIGSVGFRESGNECAYFRRISVKKI
jgi:hypothetical protein